ncbi:MAG: DUF5518 domain-containing protein [Acidobacteriota bacterium]
METQNKIKPALIGGVTLAVLSTLPFVSALNCLCCAWVVGGGALASWLSVKGSSTPIRSSDGASVGALAGFLGGVISSVISTMITFIQTKGNPQQLLDAISGQDPRVATILEPYMKFVVEHFVLVLFLSAIFNVIVFTGMGALGGVIGISLFNRRKVPPTPPPNYPYGEAGGFAPTQTPPASPDLPNPPAPPIPPAPPTTGGENPPQG